MKEKVKQILKSFGLYHPLQSSYRAAIHLGQRLYNRYAYAKYKGSGFTCNVCQASFRKFVNRFPSHDNRNAIYQNHVVAGYGENILCPHCLSTARERLVLAMLQRMELQNKKVLHFSPEKPVAEFLRTQATVVSADLFPGFYRTTDKNVVEADATQLSYAEASFDIVIANHIMEHIPEDLSAMREIYRVLRPSGHAILQVPYSETLTNTIEQPGIQDPLKQSALYGQKDHVRIYALKDYIDRLNSVGFQVKKISYDDLADLYKHAIQKHECFLEILKPIS